MSNNLLPNLIIAGVNKAATTSIFMYLSSHSDICPSKKKETGYFLYSRYGLETPPIEQYCRFFNHCSKASYIMEATGGYFYGGETTAGKIKEELPNVRIVVSLRDPIRRVFSYFKFKKSMLELDQDLSFEDYIRRCESLPFNERNRKENNLYWGIDGGFYSKYLPGWFNVFTEDEIRIIFFENFKRKPINVLTDICNWLEIESEEFISSLNTSVENKTVKYKNKYLQMIALTLNQKAEYLWRSYPRLKRTLRRIYYAINGVPYRETISEEMFTYLSNKYKPYNRELAKLLSQRGIGDLPEWIARELDSELEYHRVSYEI